MDTAPIEIDRVEQMTETEIVTLFERYKFHDDLGHPLTMCADFLCLVKRACATAGE